MEDKYCVDCRHKNTDGEGGGWKPHCTSMQRPKDLVHGEYIAVPLCRVCRETASYCGPTAKWFEPKEGK